MVKKKEVMIGKRWRGRRGGGGGGKEGRGRLDFICFETAPVLAFLLFCACFQ